MENNTIGIIDYNIGNIASIQNGFNLINANTYISNKPDEIEKFNKIVLIGVGSFPAAMKNLNEYGFANLLINHSKKRTLYLRYLCGYAIINE